MGDRFVLKGGLVLEIIQKSHGDGLEISFRLDGHDLEKIRLENQGTVRKRFEIVKTFPLTGGSTLKVAGYLGGKIFHYVFDVFVDGVLLPGSNSSVELYAAPIFIVGFYHLVSGITAGAVPTGGYLQTIEWDWGSVFLGLLFLYLGVMVFRKRRVLESRAALAIFFIDGFLSAWVFVGGHVPRERMPAAMVSLLIAAGLIGLPLHWVKNRIAAGHLRRLGVRNAV